MDSERREQGEKALREVFRLSPYEAKLYLSLLGRRMKPKEAAVVSGVPLPRVYDILNKLANKGFVREDGDAYFATPPATALDGRIAQFRARYEEELARQRSARDTLVDRLQSEFQRTKGEEGEVLLLRGIQSIANSFAEVFEECKEIYMMVRKALEAKAIFLGQLEGPAKEKRVRVILTSGTDLAPEEIKVVRSLGMEVRYHDSVMFDMLVGDKKYVMIGVPDPVSEEPYHSIAVFIKNVAFATSAARYVEGVWAHGHPVSTIHRRRAALQTER